MKQVKAKPGEKPVFPYLKQLEGSDLQHGIKTQEQFNEAESMLVGCKKLTSETTDTYNEMLAPLNKKRNVILKWKRDDLASIKNVDALLTLALRDFMVEAERQRELEAVKAIEQAEADAVAERENEIAELKALAEWVEDEGQHENGKALKEEAVELTSAPPPVPIVACPTPQVAPNEMVPVIHYSGRLELPADENKLRFVKAVAEGIIPLDAIKVNDAWINSQARSMKHSFAVPGFRLIRTHTFKRKGGIG